jgi:hypothetical protein
MSSGVVREPYTVTPERACKVCGHALSASNRADTCYACQHKAAEAALPKPVPLLSKPARVLSKPTPRVTTYPVSRGGPMEYTPNRPEAFEVQGVRVIPAPLPSAGPWPAVIERFLAARIDSALIENGKPAKSIQASLRKTIGKDKSLSVLVRDGKCYLVKRKAA